MSGHSKWATIKRKKGKTDAQRGKIFTKIGRELAIAVRDGGPDPANNSRLRDVIAKAKASNMPGDNIQRSIKKAAGEGSGVNYEEITYEGYGAGGVAVIVDTLTDNRNRTASDIRHIFDRWGNGLGTSNSVAWMFDRKGVIIIERKPGMDEDDVMMQALDAGAEDFTPSDDSFEVLTDSTNFGAVREALEKLGFTFLSAELEMIPQTTIKLMMEEDIKNVDRMLELFDDHDDVQNVYHNLEQDDEDEDE